MSGRGQQPEIKPLHVRVAEALGWRECRPSVCLLQVLAEAAPDWDGFRPNGISHPPQREMVPRFDIDWSETGPLIERLRLDLEFHRNGALWGATAYRVPVEDSDDWSLVYGPYGATPLVAVCNLILVLKAAGRLEYSRGEGEREG